ACCAEASLGYRLESQRIEVRLSFPMPAEYFHFRFHEIGSPRTTRRVLRRTPRSHGERGGAGKAYQVIDLAASHNRGHPSSVRPPSPAFAEGQLEDVRDLQVVRPVDVGHCAIQIIKSWYLNRRDVITAAHACDTDALAEGVAHVERIAAPEPTLQ